ncbi:hypothetical protein AN963_24770 [Brevibacillus choshinensis]|uniref:DUF5679 domain-containing protein n=1 Tax=Brevibacillus choshinensis TaxID=54911 RepID=A0ABR5N284_BRECH|nr:hypothetical protein AN963_24770 [Brevibacillus choshinensis]
MGYEITMSCYNQNCSNSFAVFIMGAVTFESAIDNANTLNNTRTEICPACGHVMGFFASKKEK